MGDNSASRARAEWERAGYEQQVARDRLRALLLQLAVGDELVKHGLVAPDVYLAASDGTRAVVGLGVEVAPEYQPPTDTPGEAARHRLGVLNATHRITTEESHELQALLRSALVRAARIPKQPGPTGRKSPPPTAKG